MVVLIKQCYFYASMADQILYSDVLFSVVSFIIYDVDNVNDHCEEALAIFFLKVQHLFLIFCYRYDDDDDG